MQLVGPGIEMFDTLKNHAIGPDEVVEKFGVGPERVIDVQALAGDSVDNVPGAPGIGIKTAAQLISEYGDLDTLLARAGEIRQPKRREVLIGARRADPRLARRWSRCAATCRSRSRWTARGARPRCRTRCSPSSARWSSAPCPAGWRRSSAWRRRRSSRWPRRSRGRPPPRAREPAPVAPDRPRALRAPARRRRRWPAGRRASPSAARWPSRSGPAPPTRCARRWWASRSRSARARRPTCPSAHVPGRAGSSTSRWQGQVPLEAALGILRPVLEDPAVLKIGQNVKAGVKLFARHGIRAGADRRHHAPLLRAARRAARARPRLPGRGLSRPCARSSSSR